MWIVTIFFDKFCYDGCCSLCHYVDCDFFGKFVIAMSIAQEMLHQFSIKYFKPCTTLLYTFGCILFHLSRVILFFSCEKYHVFYGNIF